MRHTLGRDGFRDPSPRAVRDGSRSVSIDGNAPNFSREHMSDQPSDVHPLTSKFLGKEMYLVITRPVRSPEIAKRLGDHLAHQVELERKGILFAAGPLYSRDSNLPEAGMFVLRANSFEEADAIAKEDPLHKAGLRTYTLQKWRLNEGRITVTVDFSDQTMKLD